ncbi:uncharacterized protein LOC131232398 [Magnolia sinica]|uniref:uncharacterized protein LOC131232398 n=1 Tax=Magnolia sinica TaxID=86752 RepID=UPI00265A89C3|nr:uncharacterized protein LOC131232398 [Magnolia sinica]
MDSYNENTKKLSLGGRLQGPRPPALKVGKNSSKIKKKAPQNSASNAVRRPVIIYLRSPEVIRVDACNFMNLVQNLTGNSSSSNRAIGCSSTGVMDHVGKADEVPADGGLVQGPQLGVDEMMDHMHLSHEMSPLVPEISSSVPSSNSFMISPNVFSNMHDFGMICYSPGYQDTTSTSPRFNL